MKTRLAALALAGTFILPCAAKAGPAIVCPQTDPIAVASEQRKPDGTFFRMALMCLPTMKECESASEIFLGGRAGSNIICLNTLAPAKSRELMPVVEEKNGKLGYSRLELGAEIDASDWLPNR